MSGLPVPRGPSTVARKGLIERGSWPISPQNPKAFQDRAEQKSLWPDRARRRPREAHLSTLEARPQAASRLSRAHGDQRRPARAGKAPRQRAEAPVGVIAGGILALPVTAIGRLKTRAEFLHVLQARQRQAGEGSSRQFDPKLARFGFTATKTLGGAVVRNRARRRLKEAVRLTGESHAIEGYDYVLIARSGTVQRPFTELIKDLERALSKVHEGKPAKKR
jgi:ribonuclease P protein component